MKISLDAALKNGWNRMKCVLFRPFDLNKWLVIGFASFLAMLGRGGGGGLNFPSGGHGGGDAQQDIRALQDWCVANMAALIFILAGAVLIGIALGVLLTWLSSRGMFVFLHCVTTNRAEIREPWGRYGHLGDRLFGFRILFGLCCFVFLVAMAAGGALVLLPYIKAEDFTLGFFLIVLALVLLFVLSVFVMAAISSFLLDFVAPIMFKRDAGVRESFGIFYDTMFKGHVWDLTLFYLLKFALGIAAGMVVMFGTCLTCCLAALPYVSSVVFLPIAVFLESYTLSYIRQHGEEWDLFAFEMDGDIRPAHETPPAPEPGNASPPPEAPPPGEPAP